MTEVAILVFLFNFTRFPDQSTPLSPEPTGCQCVEISPNTPAQDGPIGNSGQPEPQ